MRILELDKLMKGLKKASNKQTWNWSHGEMASNNHQLRIKVPVFCCSWLNVYTDKRIVEEFFAYLEIGKYACITGWRLYN